MAPKRRELRVIFSDKALSDLDEIWKWNARTYNNEHASAYVKFLMECFRVLSRDYAKGRPVNVRPELLSFTVKRSTRGNGHIAIYEYDDDFVTIVHVFHTSQDWLNKLSDERV